ncbi:(2Fe-2S)-binding protein [Marinobacter sp. HL-58]|uniref:(2Fe-2S)-binding protein n=1 Tax=Marinobacter sp. HL-58 TaxID=1479237 RepID=UPI000485E713|nr:(2Fe-2S)-binding protein [Marinobacter sp. HL-58]KPP98051.1 MAG: ferric iron reductase FhuF [Marinobacter sp. HL-58]
MAGSEQQQWARLRDAAGVSAQDIRQSYTLAGHTTAPANALTLAQCLEEPERLAREVHQPIAGIGQQKQRRIRVSVLHQNLALEVIAPLTMRLFLEGSTRLPSAAEIILVPGDETPSWSWLETASSADTETFVAEMSAQVQGWYPPFRNDHGVSPGAYWSSVGLGLGMPFSLLYNVAPPDRLCALATRWLSRFDCDANRFIEWIPAVFNGQTMAIPQRRGCCLKYLLPEGGYCGTCGVYRKERIARLNPRPASTRVSGYWPAPE